MDVTPLSYVLAISLLAATAINARDSVAGDWKTDTDQGPFGDAFAEEQGPCQFVESSTGDSRSALGQCPRGVAEDGLCVAPGAVADKAAHLIRDSFETHAFGAMIVGVWREGRPVVVGALGESMTGVPATTDMVHRIGNVSAPFLTTVFLQLVDEGVLALDDRLAKWFPELPKAHLITLEQLARSMTGYAHHPATDDFQSAFYEDPFRAWKPEELIDFGTADGTAFEPGTGWMFSDTNLLILGEVIAAATRQSTHKLIEQRIIRPLHLHSTTSPRTAQLSEPTLHGFTHERGVLEDATYWNPTWVPYAGDMASNQADVACWMKVLASGSLLSPDSRIEQTAPTTVGLGTNTADRYYAMGFGVTNGWVFANPSLQGYQGSIGHQPDVDVTIVIYVTRTRGADDTVRHDMSLFQSLGQLLAPGRPPAALPAR
jgi:D-alanyl-D-alanine carboxypeptidase